MLRRVLLALVVFAVALLVLATLAYAGYAPRIQYAGVPQGTRANPVPFRATFTGGDSALIGDDPSVVCHWYWNGTTYVNETGNAACALTQNGTVPQLASGGPWAPGMAGSGPFSDTNNYQLGTGAAADALDFTGDFLVCMRFNGNTGGGLGPVPASDSSASATAGWFMQVGSTFVAFNACGATSCAEPTTGNGPVSGPNVLCGWRTGSTISVQLNGGAVGTGTEVGAPLAAPTVPLYLGRFAGTGNSWPEFAYEFYSSSGTFTAGQVAEIQARIFRNIGDAGEQLGIGRSTTTTDIVNGRMWTWPVNVAPVDASGLKLRPSTTNYALYNQQIDNVAWTKSNTTITANTTAAPDGTTTADTAQSTVAGGYLIGTSAGAAAAASIWTNSQWVWTSSGTQAIKISVEDVNGRAAAIWVASHAYTSGTYAVPTAGNLHFYKETVASCTSSATQPTWPTGAASIVGDGTCSWTEQGLIIHASCTPTMGTYAITGTLTSCTASVGVCNTKGSRAMCTGATGSETTNTWAPVMYPGGASTGTVIAWGAQHETGNGSVYATPYTGEVLGSSVAIAAESLPWQGLNRKDEGCVSETIAADGWTYNAGDDCTNVGTRIKGISSNLFWSNCVGDSNLYTYDGTSTVGVAGSFVDGTAHAFRLEYSKAANARIIFKDGVSSATGTWAANPSISSGAGADGMGFYIQSVIFGVGNSLACR